MVLLIDNYDSFSYNLVQFVGTINPDIKVVRNDEVSCADIEAMAPSHIIISPGPGKPCDAGVCEEVIKYFAGKIPILGVCLGHQAICEVFGATVTYATKLYHGKQSEVKVVNETSIFGGLPDHFMVARYHSLACDKNTVPDELIVTSITEDGEIMSVQHRDYQVYGLQFHPESIMTPDAMKMLYNFLR